MNNKNNNPYLKKILSEISSNANKYRLNDLSWETIYEARKKKSVEEQDAPTEEPAAPAAKPAAPAAKPAAPAAKPAAPAAKPAAPAAKPAAPAAKPAAPAAKPAAPAAAGGDLPPLSGGGGDEKSKDTGTPEQTPETGANPDDKADAATEKDADASPDDSGSDEGGEDEAEQAKADATKAKAELEKAKAEKEQAEKELKKHKYVKIGSSGGTQFLLGKVLDTAFKSNTIDALAGELVEKLKIKTPEDMNAFSQEVVTYMTIPGMPELVSSMKTLATKQPETTKEEPAD